MEQRLSHRQHTLTTLGDCASPSVMDSVQAPRSCPIQSFSQCVKPCQAVAAPLPPFPWPNIQGTWHYPHPSPLQFPVLPGGSPLYTGCPQDNLSLSSTNYLGHLPQNKRENHRSSFSGVNLCLCSWYKLNLVTLYNCFNFAFTIPKALLLIGNCLFNLVFSKHCYCFSPLKRKKEKHFRKESVITFLVHPQIGIPCRSLWLCESCLSIWKVIHNKWSDRTV